MSLRSGTAVYVHAEGSATEAGVAGFVDDLGDELLGDIDE
jgi:hypothetical protein